MSGDRIGDLSDPVVPFAPDTPTAEAYERFSKDADLFCVPVVENGTPVGLVQRHDLFLKLADRFGRALYERKGASHVMDAAPLVVDANLALDELGSVILNQRPSALLTGFIVTEAGAYHGVGTAVTMLRLRMNQTQQRAEEFERAKRAAEAASHAKSRFLANMSHELRTPLNAIIGFSEIMRAEVFGTLGHRRYREYAADISKSGTHLLELINNILDLSKIEAGKEELHLEPVCLVASIHDAVRMNAPQATGAGVIVHTAVGDLRPSIRGDARKLRQILLNLLSNAVKFTPRGGRIGVSVTDNGADHVLLAVEDDGIGMSSDEIETALQPFGQIDSGLNRRYEGTGLGLPLTKSLVEMHGGKLRIVSRKGEGTRVEVILPTDPAYAIAMKSAADDRSAA